MKKFGLICAGVFALGILIVLLIPDRSIAIQPIEIGRGANSSNLDIPWESLTGALVTSLASDEFEGRGAGYPGGNMAAEFIADEFRNARLHPYGDADKDGSRSYFQEFKFGDDLVTQNVIGTIRGTDSVLRNEIVVIGAHYDHVGRADQGRHYGRIGSATADDKIFNGADDNASGVAGMIAIAHAMRTANFAPKRTIVFIAFGAEEHGLIGSEYYCNNPTVGNIKNHVFMLNLDMIGRNPHKPIEVTGWATARGEALNDICKESIDLFELNATIVDVPKYDSGDSDHSSFLSKAIPVVYFFTGLHADYHRVTDHAEKIDHKNLAKIAKAAMYIVSWVSIMEARPRFNWAEIPEHLRK